MCVSVGFPCLFIKGQKRKNIKIPARIFLFGNDKVDIMQHYYYRDYYYYYYNTKAGIQINVSCVKRASGFLLLPDSLNYEKSQSTSDFFFFWLTQRETFPERFDRVGRGKKKAYPPTHDRGGGGVRWCVYMCVETIVLIRMFVSYNTFSFSPFSTLQ